MNPLEVRLLNSVTSLLGHLDDLIDRHPVLVTMGVLYLVILLGVLVIVRLARRRAKGLVQPGPRVIYIQSANSPPEPPFDPFPIWRECDCEHDQDD